MYCYKERLCLDINFIQVYPKFSLLSVFGKFLKFWKFLKSSPKNFPEIPGKYKDFYRANPLLQSTKLYFYYCENNENPGKFPRNFGEISEIPKIHEKFSPKNSRKTGVFFTVKYNETGRKSIFSFLWKYVNSGKTSGEISGKFHKFQKFGEELSPENFPEIPGVFFG